MYMDKRILAIIPARSGSKGIKDKNIKLLQGKPLIAYSIEAAKKSNVFDNIIVSTDSSIYKDIAIKFGGEVPFLRPADLATDTATTTDVIVHLLEELKRQGQQYDYFMILQPTSPLRSEQNILESIQMLYEKDANAVVSMCECEHPIQWTTYIDESQCLDGFFENNLGRRQEQKTFYRLNGAIYLAKVEYYLKYKNFYQFKSYAYIMDKYNSIDIDDIYDFTCAEAILRSRSLK